MAEEESAAAAWEFDRNLVSIREAPRWEKGVTRMKNKKVSQHVQCPILGKFLDFQFCYTL